MSLAHYYSSLASAIDRLRQSSGGVSGASKTIAKAYREERIVALTKLASIFTVCCGALHPVGSHSLSIDLLTHFSLLLK
jgi:hypothetical protein